MGQFSWCCALCDQEVMHGRQPGYQWTTDAVILWPNGDRRSGRYEDGYGNIGGIDLVDMQYFGPSGGGPSENVGGWRLVHQRCLDEHSHFTTKELFASFCEERHASDQGWWPGERVAIKRYGEPERSELKELQTYVCYECKHVWQAHWSGGNCPFGCKRPKNYRDSPELIREGYGDSHEMVEPFRYLDYRHGHANGVVLCKNEAVTRTDWNRYHAMRKEGTLDEDNPPTDVSPCFYHGEPQQARVTEPDDWEDNRLSDEPEEFEVYCRGCKSRDVEIVPLTEVSS